jgi:hypothetical protein
MRGHSGDQATYVPIPEDAVQARDGPGEECKRDACDCSHPLLQPG